MQYIKDLIKALEGIDQTNLEKIAWTIRGANCVYVCGNGGSASIANHLCCDWTKAAEQVAHSLSANSSLLTALGNDLGYEYIYSQQIHYYASNEDVVVLISSSGNSPNILEAAKAAQQKGCYVVGLIGFDGGKLKALCDDVVHIPVNDYGVVEDCHQTVMHILSRMLQ